MKEIRLRLYPDSNFCSAASKLHDLRQLNEVLRTLPIRSSACDLSLLMAALLPGIYHNYNCIIN
jgi:hypothetical protein